MNERRNKRTATFNEPIRGVEWLVPEQCKDCMFRDKTTVEEDDGRIINVGASRSTCIMFPYPDIKPMDVMENIAECDYYEKE